MYCLQVSMLECSSGVWGVEIRVRGDESGAVPLLRRLVSLMGVGGGMMLMLEGWVGSEGGLSDWDLTWYVEVVSIEQIYTHAVLTRYERIAGPDMTSVHRDEVAILKVPRLDIHMQTEHLG